MMTLRTAAGSGWAPLLCGLVYSFLLQSCLVFSLKYHLIFLVPFLLFPQKTVQFCFNVAVQKAHQLCNSYFLYTVFVIYPHVFGFHLFPYPCYQSIALLLNQAAVGEQSYMQHLHTGLVYQQQPGSSFLKGLITGIREKIKTRGDISIKLQTVYRKQRSHYWWTPFWQWHWNK